MGNYQQYMDQYAGSYKKYMNKYAGEYEKYQNYQKYKDCDSSGKVRSAKDANTTAQLDEWYKGAEMKVVCFVPDDYSANKYASQEVDRQYKRRLAELNNGGSQSNDICWGVLTWCHICIPCVLCGAPSAKNPVPCSPVGLRWRCAILTLYLQLFPLKMSSS